MRRIAPIGKKNFVGKKFKSAGPNELNASDKNFIRNNINQFNTQQLAFKVGKSVAVVEKFIKKEKLNSTFEVKKVSEPIKLIETDNKTGSSEKKKEKERKRSKIVLKKIDFIKENHQKYSAIEMAKELNISITGIRYLLKTLNIIPLTKERIPNDIIIERRIFIQENHRKHTVSELSEKLNCSLDIVRHTLRKLKLTALRVSKGKETSPQAIHFIKVNYRTMTAREMSKALGNISWTQVKYLCEKYGFLKTPEETAAIRNRWNKSEFTASEEKYIIANHGIISLAEISINIERTRSSVVKFLARKGLKITKEQHNVLNRKNFEKARMKYKEKIVPNIRAEL